MSTNMDMNITIMKAPKSHRKGALKMGRKIVMSIQIYLKGGIEQREDLKAYAKSKGLSLSELVIEAISRMKVADGLKQEAK